jgi:hypothetical protein
MDAVILNINHFRLHGERSPEAAFQNFLVGNQSAGLSSEKQASVINSISNDTCPAGRGQVRYSAYFSCGSGDDCLPSGKPKYLPTSPRNRLIYNITNSSIDTVREVLAGILNESETTSKKRKHCPRSNSSRTDKIEDAHHTLEFDLPTMPDVAEASPFIKFTTHVVEKGTIRWRIHSPHVDVIAMNDVDLKLGTFQVNKFTHIWRFKELGQDVPSFTCDCNMYTVLLRMGSGHSPCVHIRFFQEFLEPLFELAFTRVSSLPESPIGTKLKDALLSCNSGVVQLDSGSRNHCFSVMAQDAIDCALVTLEGSRFRCHNGQCRAMAGHTRKTNRLDDPKAQLCQHLRVMWSQQEIWNHLVGKDGNDEDTDHEIVHGRQDSLPVAEESPAANSMIVSLIETEIGLFASKKKPSDVPTIQN